MFKKTQHSQSKQMLPGVYLSSLVHGDKTLLVEFRFEAGSSLPMHQHPYEQTGYLISGHMRLTIGEQILDVEAGDSWCIPGETPHGAEVIDDSVAVEVFSPVREDYLPENLYT